MGHIEGVQLTPQKIIELPAGNVLHVLKNHEASFNGFGEAYFSTVNYNSPKGWKRHRKMTLNVVVPVGTIKFVLFDNRVESKTYQQLQEVVLSKDNYQRLTVPSGVWMAFKGMTEGLNMLLNIADILHDPEETDNLPLENNIIPYTGFTK
ncbi:MAG: dTDP-4-dehydrorhamnose 3,5-epimerase family protein [Chitinophagaceae bacterium]|nr:dTDP-4-dehydrorhamnose 3,5-epimerase family protein [Chitinophagaceae bacterium]